MASATARSVAGSLSSRPPTTLVCRSTCPARQVLVSSTTLEVSPLRPVERGRKWPASLPGWWLIHSAAGRPPIHGAGPPELPSRAH